MSILQIKLEEFEGPIDLLLKLINKNKIDIYDIPISKLTDDYLYYIKNSDIKDMNEMSKFILMATTLLEIKSKMLLPKEKNEETNEEIDPREELVQKLIEYKKYKLIAEKLYNTEIFIEKSLFKQEDKNVINNFNIETKPNIEDILDGVSLQDLYNIFKDVLKRKDLKTDKIRSNFKYVTKAIYTVENKMVYIKDLIVLNGQISFIDLLKESSCKSEVVVTFLAILELIKTRDIKAYQKNIFGDILISKGDI